MRLMKNVNDWERVASIVAGAAVLALSARRQSRPKGRLLTGAGLIVRGAAGFCPVNYAVGRERHRDDTRQALGGSRGIHLKDQITIARPADEIYRYWRNLENLPRFMPHIEQVTTLDDRRSHWIVRGPAGTRVEWDAEINNEVEGELIGWRSLPGSDVASAGSVHFRSMGARGTFVVVTMQYDPPAGRLGASMAWLLGESPAKQLHQDLHRLKDILEGDARPVTQKRKRARRGKEPGDSLEAGI